MGLAATGCGSSDDNGKSDQAEASNGLALVSDGTLTACSSMTFPPFEYFEPGSTEPVGSDIEIGKALADRFGVELKVVDTPFSALIGAVKGRRCDLGLMSLFPTDERLKEVDIVSYVASNSSFMVRAGDEDKYADPLAFSGKRVSVLVGAIQVGNLEELNTQLKAQGKEPIKIVQMEADNAAQAALTTKRVDGFVTDAVAAAQRVKASDDLAIAGPELPPVGVPPALGMVVDKSNTALSGALSEAFKAFYEDGTIKDALTKYDAEAYLLSDESLIGKIYQ